MLKRRIDTEDKCFIKIVLCIFRHDQTSDIDFGILKEMGGRYSLPSIVLKRGENLEDTIVLAMDDYAGKGWSDLPFGGEKKILGCVNFNNDSTISILCRIDIPASCRSASSLTWLDVDSLFDITHDEEATTEETRKIILQSVYSQ